MRLWEFLFYQHFGIFNELNYLLQPKKAASAISIGAFDFSSNRAFFGKDNNNRKLPAACIEVFGFNSNKTFFDKDNGNKKLPTACIEALNFSKNRVFRGGGTGNKDIIIS